MLPKAFTESDIAELFSPFGTIEDCSVLKEASGQSKGRCTLYCVLTATVPGPVGYGHLD